MWTIAALLLVGAGGAALSTPDSSPTLFVDEASVGGQCSDSRSARAAATPKRPLCSIQRALILARRGWRVIVREGSYPPLAVSSVQGDDGYLTIEGFADERVSIPAVKLEPEVSHLRLRRLVVGPGVADTIFAIHVVEGGAHHLAIEDSVIETEGAAAIGLRWGTREVLIEGNVIRPANGGNGINFTSTSCAPGSPACDPRAPISDVTIRGNEIDLQGSGTDAIRPANFRRLVVEGNDITGVVEDGSHNDVLQVVWGGRHLDFNHNYVHDNKGQGFFIDDGRVVDARVENNLFVRNGLGSQIQIGETEGLRLVNNTVWDNSRGVLLRAGVKRAVVRHNVFESMNVENPPGNLPQQINQDHNLIVGGWNWGARGPHDLRVRPPFVDRAKGDYRLEAGGPSSQVACRRGADLAKMGAFAQSERAVVASQGC